MRERRETSAGFRRLSYHACAGVSLTTSDVFLTCELNMVFSTFILRYVESKFTLLTYLMENNDWMLEQILSEQCQ